MRGGPIDVDAAKREITTVLTPAGFDHVTDRRDERANISWYDTEDGGYFYLIIVPDSHTAFSYGSGCRPTNGPTTIEQARTRTPPDWETTLPPFSNPTPTSSPTDTTESGH